MSRNDIVQMQKDNVKYPHLNLYEWPFRDVPDEQHCSFLADRIQLKTDVLNLLEHLSRRNTSTMHLMWAWFGAGKTHTLYHIRHLCKSKYINLMPLYGEFPRTVRGFEDIYKSFLSQIDMEAIDEAYIDVFGDSYAAPIQNNIKGDHPDLANALRFHFMGDEIQQDIAFRWLRAEMREMKALRSIGVMKPLDDSEDFVKTTAWLIRLLGYRKIPISNENVRILWMIDEFQRLGNSRSKVQEEVNSCIHSVFNRCPNYLSVVMSFSGHPEEKVLPQWLSKEIKDRIGIEKVLLLPPLRSEEAVVFVKDVLKEFRPWEPVLEDPLFPFCDDSIGAVISIIQEKKDELKPRRLMQYFSAVLEEAEPLIASAKLHHIDRNFVMTILKDRVFLD